MPKYRVELAGNATVTVFHQQSGQIIFNSEVRSPLNIWPAQAVMIGDDRLAVTFADGATAIIDVKTGRRL